MRSILRSVSVAGLLSAGLLAGCVAPSGGGPDRPSPPVSANEVKLKGTVAYRERIMLDPNARVEVKLIDVSRADAPSIDIARTEFGSAGRQVPLPFELTYDKSKIDPRGRYAVSARITGADGRLMWISDTHYALPPAGEPVALMLVSAGASR